MRRGFALLLLGAAAGLSGCSAQRLVDVIEHEGRVLFTTEREWRWFLVPHRPPMRVSGLDVWLEDRWVWRIRAPQGESLMLPIRFGDAPRGAVQLVAPAPLRKGRIYGVRLDMWETTFRVEPGGEVIADPAIFAPNPDLLAEMKRSERRLTELMATGMTEEAARRAFVEEQPRGVRY